MTQKTYNSQSPHLITRHHAVYQAHSVQHPLNRILGLKPIRLVRQGEKSQQTRPGLPSEVCLELGARAEGRESFLTERPAFFAR